MEKGQTRKDKILMLETEITSLSANLANLDAERSALSYKNIEGQMTNGDYRRAAEIDRLISDFSAQKRKNELEVRRLRHEEILEIERMTADETRKDAEAYSKGEPEKKASSKGKGGKTAFFAVIALLVVIGILAYKDKGAKTPSVNQLYEQEIEGLKSRTPMSVEEIKEALVGVQRMLYSGRLPKEEYLGTITYDYYLAKSTEILGMLGNPKNNNGSYESIDHADWAKEELLKKFIEKYDDVYNDIAEDLNAGNYESLEANIRKLADMQFDDFKMAGLKGGINPYGFKPQYRMAALLAATDRYSMVAEYVLKNNICWDACKNQATGKMTQAPVFSMYEVLFIDGGVSTDGKIALDSLGTSFPKDQSLYDIFLSEGYSYFQAREDNPITRILK